MAILVAEGGGNKSQLSHFVEAKTRKTVTKISTVQSSKFKVQNRRRLNQIRHGAEIGLARSRIRFGAEPKQG